MTDDAKARLREAIAVATAFNEHLRHGRQPSFGDHPICLPIDILIEAARQSLAAEDGREPCKGKNCGSTKYWLHSHECFAEHDATVNAAKDTPK